MQRRKVLITVPALLLAATAHAEADKTAKQAEIRQKAMQTLQDFYKADAGLKDEVSKAAGFAVFTTYGLSFGLGGAGGKGLAHDNKSKKDTYMNVGQASAGLQIGASDTRYLFIFQDAKALADFVEHGWEASANASAGAGTGTSAANAGAGGGNVSGGKMFALTKTGLQAGGAVGGLKAWKDKDLN